MLFFSSLSDMHGGSLVPCGHRALTSYFCTTCARCSLNYSVVSLPASLLTSRLHLNKVKTQAQQLSLTTRVMLVYVLLCC